MGTLIRERNIIGVTLASLMVLSAFAGMILIVPEYAEGAFRFVGPNSTYGTIQDALDDATTGDIIVLDQGTFNGSFRSDLGSIIIRGNSSTGSILVLNGTEPSHLGGNGTFLSDLTITNGTLWMTGNNQNITNVIIDAGDATVELRNNTGTMMTNITFTNPLSTGLYMSNCTSIKTDLILSNGVEGELIIVENSINIRMEKVYLGLNSTAKGIWVDSTFGLILDDVHISSTNGTNIGVLIGNSSQISMIDSTFQVEGYGAYIETSDGVYISENRFFPQDNGSVGLVAELVTNMTIDAITGNSEFNSDILNIRMSMNIEFKNSSLIMDGGSSGVLLNGCTNFLTYNVDITGNGEGSIGYRILNSNSIEITGIVWVGDGKGSIFTSISDVTEMILNNSDIGVDGMDSFGISQENSVSGLLIHDLVLDVTGQGAKGIFVDGAIDSRFHSNYITASGEGSSGLFANGNNLTLTGNLFTISGDDANGATLTGADIFTSSERWFAIGDRSVALLVENLMSLTINECRADSSGIESSSLILNGMGGTYHFKNSNIVGNKDISDLAMIDDAASLLFVDNTTFHSASHATALTITALTASIEDSSISSTGTACFLKNGPSVRFISNDIVGTIPVRSSGSIMDIVDCDLGISSESLEAISGSIIHVIDTPLNGVLVDPSSIVLVSNSMSIETIDRFDEPLSGVDIRILTEGHPIYQTSFFNDTDPDPVTDPNGMVGPMIIDHRIFDGMPMPYILNNTITVHLSGTSPQNWDMEYPINASAPGIITVRSPDIDLPNVPKGLKATALDTREDIRLSWTPNEDDTIEYRIFELDMEDMSTWSMIGTVVHPLATWTSQDLGPSVRRIYRITAWDGEWESSTSTIASTETKDLTAPPSPTELTFGIVTQTSITLQWEHSGSSDLQGFSLFMNGSLPAEMIKIADIDPSSREYTVDDLDWGTSYKFRLRAYDASGNPSSFTSDLEVITAMIQLSVFVKVNYSGEGPLAGMPVFNGTVSLISFNGTVVSFGQLDANGEISFTGLVLDEIYRLHVLPHAEYIGQENETDGYIPVLGDNFQLTEDNTDMTIRMTLPYYFLPSIGNIEVNVLYGEGPRTGAIYQAYVQLVDDEGTPIGEGLTDPSGKMAFTIPDLPFRGRFNVEAPLGIGGDISEDISGYLSQTTNFFTLDHAHPDHGTFTVELVYFEYIAPPDPLMIDRHYPMGTSVSLDSDIRIDFNQPMDKGSVMAHVKVIPALAGISYSWDEFGRNLTISHDGFLPLKEYTVIVEFGATSLEGTSFPSDYSSNQWTFTTVAEEKDDGNDEKSISDEVLWAILIGLVVVIIIVGSYIYSSRRKEEEIDDDDVYALADEEYYDEEDYPEDDELMGDDMSDYPEDDEYYDEEEYLEDEEYPEEELAEDLEEDVPVVEEDLEEEMMEEEMDEEEMPPEEVQAEEEVPPEEVIVKEKEPKQKKQKKKKGKKK